MWIFLFPETDIPLAQNLFIEAVNHPMIKKKYPMPISPFNLAIHALNQSQLFGPGTLRKMIACAKNEDELFNSASFDFLDSSQKDALTELKKQFNPAREEANLRAQEISIVTPTSQEYPQKLKEIPLPPPILYLRGNSALLKEDFSLAIVGTRKMTNYGRIAAHKIIPGLVRAGFCIVSGLAIGIDALAHEICLQENGKTIAVLAAGIDNNSIYPRKNYGLAQKILRNNGLLMGEYPPGCAPQKFHFPVRNRIISGIASGTMVIEAQQKSGSLITAQTALEQHRNVYSIPGPIHSPASQGTNMLIQQGAKPVLSTEDILNEYQNINIHSARQIQQSFILLPAEQRILQLLTSALDFDELVEQSNLLASQVSTALMMLELKGLIKQINPHCYIKL